jgi:hypothetical protein
MTLRILCKRIFHGLRATIRHEWLLKGPGDLDKILPGCTSPEPLSADYLVLIIEYRKREYLLAAEKLNKAKWYRMPKLMWRVHRAKRAYLVTSRLLTTELARLVAIDQHSNQTPSAFANRRQRGNDNRQKHEDERQQNDRQQR